MLTRHKIQQVRHKRHHAPKENALGGSGVVKNTKMQDLNGPRVARSVLGQVTNTRGTVGLDTTAHKPERENCLDVEMSCESTMMEIQQSQSQIQHQHQYHQVQQQLPKHKPKYESNPDAFILETTQEDSEELAKVDVEYKNKPGVFDETDQDTFDPSLVAEYAPEIFQYLHELDKKYLPDVDYMSRQPELTWSKRSLLIDWIVRVHGHCELLPETLFLTINLIDRFLALKPVSEEKLQLVGVAALFVACKYEEITFPTVQEIAYLADNAYSVDEIIQAERFLVNLFDFELGAPGPMSFLRRSSKADDYDNEIRTVAKYLIEVAVMDHRFVGAQMGWIAAASHCLARKILDRGEWTSAHVYFSGYTERQIEPLIKGICEGCMNVSGHKAVFRKYNQQGFMWVSVHVHQWLKNRMR